MARLPILTLFVGACLLIFHRQNLSHRITTYSPSPLPSLANSQLAQDPKNFYRIGKYDIKLAPVSKWSFKNPTALLNKLSRKKINGFLFTQYNLYKLEINFIDLGYSSLVQINSWTHDTGHHSIQQRIGFELDEDFNTANLNLNIQKNNFKLFVRQNIRIGRFNHTQLVTTFNITVQQKDIQFNANYTHVRRDQQCVTIVRDGVISLKCYGGYGYGKIRLGYVFYDKLEKQNKKKISSFNPKVNQTKCGFDGFRANGWDWKWMWMYSQGFSKPEFYANNHTVIKEHWIGFNFGSLNGKSEDFLFLNGKIYPIKGAKYEINEKFSQGKNLTIKAKDPEMSIDFMIMNKTLIQKDTGIFKNDMIKAEGHFVGYVIDPQDHSHKVNFYEMSAMLEIANSFF